MSSNTQLISYHSLYASNPSSIHITCYLKPDQEQRIDFHYDRPQPSVHSDHTVEKTIALMAGGLWVIIITSAVGAAGLVHGFMNFNLAVSLITVGCFVGCAAIIGGGNLYRTATTIQDVVEPVVNTRQPVILFSQEDEQQTLPDDLWRLLLSFVNDPDTLESLESVSVEKNRPLTNYFNNSHQRTLEIKKQTFEKYYKEFVNNMINPEGNNAVHYVRAKRDHIFAIASMIPLGQLSQEIIKSIVDLLPQYQWCDCVPIMTAIRLLPEEYRADTIASIAPYFQNTNLSSSERGNVIKVAFLIPYRKQNDQVMKNLVKIFDHSELGRLDPHADDRIVETFQKIPKENRATTINQAVSLFIEVVSVVDKLKIIEELHEAQDRTF